MNKVGTRLQVMNGKAKQTSGGLTKKELVLEKICKKYKINLEEIAFIGDDVNDIGVLEKVGFAAVPNDSVLQVKKIANFVCKSPGGKGCFREISDLILLSKFSTKTKWY